MLVTWGLPTTRGDGAPTLPVALAGGKTCARVGNVGHNAALFFLRLWLSLRAGIVEHDGAMYARLARELLEGDLSRGVSTLCRLLFPRYSPRRPPSLSRSGSNSIRGCSSPRSDPPEETRRLV